MTREQILAGMKAALFHLTAIRLRDEAEAVRAGIELLEAQVAAQYVGMGDRLAELAVLKAAGNWGRDGDRLAAEAELEAAIEAWLAPKKSN